MSDGESAVAAKTTDAALALRAGARVWGYEPEFGAGRIKEVRGDRAVVVLLGLNWSVPVADLVRCPGGFSAVSRHA